MILTTLAVIGYLGVVVVAFIVFQVISALICQGDDEVGCLWSSFGLLCAVLWPFALGLVVCLLIVLILYGFVGSVCGAEFWKHLGPPPRNPQ